MASKSDEKMKIHNINFPPTLWLRARQKAGYKSLAEIIRELVTLWVDGLITLPSEISPPNQLTEKEL